MKNVALWVVQIFLAVAFLGAGGTKLFLPVEALAVNGAWVLAIPEPLLRFIGLSEVLGALGLVLPWATKIQPRLTPLAGALLALVMVLAAGFHLMRAEPALVVPNIVLGSLAAVIAWGRR